jgi:hypothetical protein
MNTNVEICLINNDKYKTVLVKDIILQQIIFQKIIRL